MVARRVLVAGRVQGVGFRYACIDQARRIGVGGWVRNLVDGGVEVHVEGDEEKVAALIAWLHRGPVFAKVESVEVSGAEAFGTRTFGLG